MNRAANVGVALLHHPVYDKNHQIVSTAVTNLDIHDIARAARTFGLARYYIVTPVPGQQSLVGRVVGHWQEGWGSTYNPKRKAALELVRVMNTLDDALRDMEKLFDRPAKLVVTGARGNERNIAFPVLAEMIAPGDQPFLIVLGTGWGLAEEVFARADYILEPIRGTGDYNHLSVRGAAAIIMDRLFGAR